MPRIFIYRHSREAAEGRKRPMGKRSEAVTKDNTPIRKKRRRFTWDDLELTLLSLPTIFCFTCLLA